jgi:8-oxo-dGTP pyrophosphatase MutT (NUDIX family)
MTENSVAPIPAATLIVVRANENQVPEILLLKRSATARFMPNAYVFAGGAVDAVDSADKVYGLCRHLGDAGASARLDLPKDGLRFYVAAIRETFEEAGLLFAYDQAGDLVDFCAWDEAQLRRIRSAGASTADLHALCTANNWHLATDRLCFFSHWITPRGSQRRFDTRFFIARAPSRQVASLANTEMSELVWRTAADALGDQAQGRLMLMLPTRTVIQEIAQFEHIDSLLKSARQRSGISPITPDLPGLGY